MRILFYTNSFYPDPIGIAFYNAEWVERLHALGHEVEVLTALPYYPQWKVLPAYRGRWRVEERYQGVRVTRTWVFVPRRQTPLGRFLCELSFLISSLPYLLARRHRLVIAVSPPFGVGLAAAVVSRISKVALWLHVQDLQVDAGQAVGFLKNGALLRLLRGLERFIFNSANELSTITEAMRKRVLGKEIARPVHVFANWVDTEAMRPSEKENEFRKSHGLSKSFVVLYAGNLGIHQGLDHLLEAAEHLRDRPAIRFVIVGQGNYGEALAEKVRLRHLSNVCLLPLQPKENLSQMLAAADVGIVLETRKMANLSMPSKILNQMACGRPLIAVTSPESALSRMVTEAGAGIVLSPGNANLLAMAILDLASAPEKIAAMGARARAFVCEAASKERILSCLPETLDRALKPIFEGPLEYRFKRALDIGLALLGFAVSSPLWLIVPFLIWAEDHGPVFYAQERVGRGGRLFRAYKFRSMRKMELPQFDRRQAKRGDPRVTVIGAALRRTAMDEVPQLWNILKGDMSFVGPRALMPKEVEVSQAYRGEVSLDRIPGYDRRVALRPGLTGIAQVYAARDISRRNKFRYDLLYSFRQSLWLDLRLILRSGWNSLTARWEAVGQVARERRLKTLSKMT